VVVLVTTVTFGASLDNLVSHPALYGWNWNYALLSGFAGQEDLPGHQIATLLNQDPDIKAWFGRQLRWSQARRPTVPMLTERPGSSVAPPLLSGHGLDASDQVVLGGTTLTELHKRVGDTVTFANRLAKPRRLLIVGTATMPSMTTSGLGMGTGAMVSDEAIFRLRCSISNRALFRAQMPSSFASEPGPTPRRHTDLLRRSTTRSMLCPMTAARREAWFSLLRPAEIVNFRSWGLLRRPRCRFRRRGDCALGLTLGASVRRRRRDLALLKALGFTQRQLATSIAWQATVAAVIGIVFGIPFGIVVGRELLDTFAHNINAVPNPTVPLALVLLVGIGALAFANLVAALPRVAQRTPRRRSYCEPSDLRDRVPQVNAGE